MISNSEDFKGTVPIAAPPPPPVFSLLKISERIVCLVLDKSESMGVSFMGKPGHVLGRDSTDQRAVRLDEDNCVRGLASVAAERQMRALTGPKSHVPPAHRWRSGGEAKRQRGTGRGKHLASQDSAARLVSFTHWDVWRLHSLEEVRPLQSRWILGALGVVSLWEK